MEFDKAVADKLQRLLEKYVPPVSIVPKSERKKLRLFRDETELASSSNLSDEIKRALESSRFLIVICSKATKDSHWCRQEIEYFKELHNGSVGNILTLLIEGEPAEVFPGELRFETYTYEDDNGNLTTGTKEVEPLATNISAPSRNESFKKLKQEYLRLVAPLLRCRFDDLYNRNQRRRNRRNLLIAASFIVFLALFGIYSSIMMFQINTQRAEAQANYEEAEIQRLLALANLEEAETQRTEAETQRIEAETQRIEAEAQRAEADVQRELAVHNLEEVKYLLLSNAIDYAERLNNQGARSRAGAVLKRVYANIDGSRGDAEFLYSRFRDVALDTLFYMDESLPFVRQELSGEIIQITPVAEHGHVIVTTAEYLYQVDIDNGDIQAAFPAPEGDQFYITSVHGTTIFAMTKNRNVNLIAIDGIAQEPPTLLEESIRYYEGDNVATFKFNENISALIIVNYISGWFYNNPESITYISSEEGEMFTKIILTVIPFDLAMMDLRKEDTQVFVYRASRPGQRFQVSENGRFITFVDQFVQRVSSDRDGWSAMSVQVNSDIMLIDIDAFCPILDVKTNNQNMLRVIDSRFNGEDYFRIFRFSISNQGILQIDGSITEGEYGVSDLEYSTQRTIVYDTESNEILFNEQLASEGSNLLWSPFLEIANQYHYEHQFYLLSYDGSSALVYKASPDVDTLLDEARDFIGAQTDYEMRALTHKLSTDRWLLYLSVQEEDSIVKIFDLDRENDLLGEYKLPNGFNITQSFLYDRSGPIFHDVSIVLVGEMNGRSKVIRLRAALLMIDEARREMEKQTLDIATSSGAMLLEPERLFLGYPNGVLLMYNFGMSPKEEDEEIDSSRSVGFGNIVLIGDGETNVVLQQVTDAIRIETIAYNKDRTLMFGREDDIGAGNVYSIWSLETGEVIRSFYSTDFLPEESWRNNFSVRINNTFTYTIVEVRERETRTYYIIDASTGETVHLYNYYREVESGSRTFFGIGATPDVIWIFHPDTLLLEEIDVSDGNVINQRYISKRMEDGGLFNRAWYSGVYYHIGSDIIIFKGSNSYIYSFTSERTIFIGNIDEVELDTSVIYTSFPMISRIPLEAEALFEVLSRSPFVGTMTERDLKETGLDIFEN